MQQKTVFICICQKKVVPLLPQTADCNVDIAKLGLKEEITHEALVRAIHGNVAHVEIVQQAACAA